jgi:hypothetical protein
MRHKDITQHAQVPLGGTVWSKKNGPISTWFDMAAHSTIIVAHVFSWRTWIFYSTEVKHSVWSLLCPGGNVPHLRTTV